MKAIIRLDVPEFQIGQPVQVYFKDTMMINGICEADEDENYTIEEWTAGEYPRE
jgi:hypothetical protein